MTNDVWCENRMEREADVIDGMRGQWRHVTTARCEQRQGDNSPTYKWYYHRSNRCSQTNGDREQLFFLVIITTYAFLWHRWHSSEYGTDTRSRHAADIQLNRYCGHQNLRSVCDKTHFVPQHFLHPEPVCETVCQQTYDLRYNSVHSSSNSKQYLSVVRDHPRCIVTALFWRIINTSSTCERHARPAEKNFSFPWHLQPTPTTTLSPTTSHHNFAIFLF